MSVNTLFLDCSSRKILQQNDRIRVCLAQLSEPQVWVRSGENENAVGNLVLHLAGNVRQWILSGLAGQPDRRIRDLEFSSRNGPSGGELTRLLTRTVEEAAALFTTLTEDQLTRMYEIQKYRVSGVEVVLHVVEHFSYHTGQIIFATKAMTGDDLAFYAHLNSLDQADKTP